MHRNLFKAYFSSRFFSELNLKLIDTGQVATMRIVGMQYISLQIFRGEKSSPPLRHEDVKIRFLYSTLVVRGNLIKRCSQVEVYIPELEIWLIYLQCSSFWDMLLLPLFEELFEQKLKCYEFGEVLEFVEFLCPSPFFFSFATAVNRR